MIEFFHSVLKLYYLSYIKLMFQVVSSIVENLENTKII